MRQLPDRVASPDALSDQGQSALPACSRILRLAEQSHTSRPWPEPVMGPIRTLSSQPPEGLTRSRTTTSGGHSGPTLRKIRTCVSRLQTRQSVRGVTGEVRESFRKNVSLH
jgi:hypothetical protein